MKLNSRNKIGLATLSIILSTVILVYGQTQGVVTLGNDLNQQQREQMLNLFKVEEGKVKTLVVTNAEERQYLEGVATEQQIGTRAISSAYVEGLEAGEGIQVETYNITWVTEDMFRNALVTAGVKDARIIAGAPFNVSGTAALTGILKAFEALRGQEISEEQKQVANEEIVKTGELGEAVGKEKAVQLIQAVKEEVIEKNIKSPEEIRRIIIEISGRLDINLNNQQVEELTKLMERITRLNLNTNEIRRQLQGIGEKLGEITRQNEEVRSLLERIIDFIRQLFESILGMILGKK